MVKDANRPDPPDPPEAAEPRLDGMIGAVYAELRSLAAAHLRSEKPGHTLQPTALVHEAYIRLSKQQGLDWNDRLHFLRIASGQIRKILVDHARSRSRLKRGGDRTLVTLTESTPDRGQPVDLIELDDALNKLDTQSNTIRQIVELKFFGGLTEHEIATALSISERTVRRRWVFARTWLFQELEG